LRIIRRQACEITYGLSALLDAWRWQALAHDGLAGISSSLRGSK